MNSVITFHDLVLILGLFIDIQNCFDIDLDSSRYRDNATQEIFYRFFIKTVYDDTCDWTFWTWKNKTKNKLGHYIQLLYGVIFYSVFAWTVSARPRVNEVKSN